MAAASAAQLWQDCKDGNLQGVQEAANIAMPQDQRAALLSQGDPNAYRRTALHKAALNGHTAIVDYLIEMGAEVDGHDKNNWTALMEACRKGHTATAALLIAKGADVEARDERKMTTLMWAAKNGHATTAELLIAKGADMEARGPDSQTVLMYASMDRLAATAQVLIAKGATVTAKDDRLSTLNHQTALIFACGKGHTATAELLIANGADLEAKDKDNMTALRWACNEGHTATAEMLIAKGARVKTNWRGKSSVLDSLRSKEDRTRLAQGDPTSQAGSDAELQAAARARLDQVAGGKVPYNAMAGGSVGPGGSGKTQTHRSVMGEPFDEARNSTVGTDKMVLEVRQTKMQTLDLQPAGSCTLLERVVRTAAAEKQAMDRGIEDLVDNTASCAEVESLEAMLQEAEFDIQLHGYTHGAPSRTRSAGHGSMKRTSATQRQGTLRTDSQDQSSALQSTTAASQSESVQMLKLTQDILTKGGGGSSAIQLTWTDTGGQVQFAPIVTLALRNNMVLSVTARLDELKANIINNTTVFSDSKSRGVDELFEWLHAVASTTSQGPVLLVMTFADKVSSKADWKIISDYIAQELDRCDHALMDRLVKPGNGLLFFPIDNTKGGGDAGVQAYKAKLKELCETNDSVHMPVPFALIKLQDKLTLLAKPTSSKDTPMIEQLRRDCGSAHDGSLSYVYWGDVQLLYKEGLELGEVYNEHDLQTLVDFMDLQGVVMHNNAEVLRDLVIINQEWLIKQLTMIIRDPKLHNKEVDKRMGKMASEQLYQDGLLSVMTIPKIWPDMPEDLQAKLLALMRKLGLAFPVYLTSDQGKAEPGLLIPSLLPDRDVELSEREPMTAGMPLTKLVLALHMGEQLGKGKESHLTQRHVTERCVLPMGFTEQLVGALVQLAQAVLVPPHISSMVLTRYYARIPFDAFEIELSRERDGRFISITLHATEATGLLAQFTRCIHQLITAQFRCLRSILLVNITPTELVPLVALQAIGMKASATIKVGTLKLDADYVRRQFPALLPTLNQGTYHAFLSYRHGRLAANAAEAIYRYLTIQVLGEHKVEVFRDCVKLKAALPFDEGFMQAMLQSLVVVTLITPATLERMKLAGGLDVVDSVLLEWWLAMTLLESPGYPVLRIAPIVCGTVDDNDGMVIQDLFQEMDLTDFPDQVNQPTLARLNRFLKGVGRPEVEAVTVRGLVDRMMKMNVPDACQCWKVFDKQCKANVSHLSEEQRRTKRVLELQRVVVSCSRPVFGIMQEAFQEWGDAEPSATIATGVTLDPTAALQDMGMEELGVWLTEHNLAELGPRFRELEVKGKDLGRLQDSELKTMFGMSKLEIARFRAALTDGSVTL